MRPPLYYSHNTLLKPPAKSFITLWEGTHPCRGIHPPTHLMSYAWLLAKLKCCTQSRGYYLSLSLFSNYYYYCMVCVCHSMCVLRQDFLKLCELLASSYKHKPVTLTTNVLHVYLHVNIPHIHVRIPTCTCTYTHVHNNIQHTVVGCSASIISTSNNIYVLGRPPLFKSNYEDTSQVGRFLPTSSYFSVQIFFSFCSCLICCCNWLTDSLSLSREASSHRSR